MDPLYSQKGTQLKITLNLTQYMIFYYGHKFQQTIIYRNCIRFKFTTRCITSNEESHGITTIITIMAMIRHTIQE